VRPAPAGEAAGDGLSRSAIGFPAPGQSFLIGVEVTLYPKPDDLAGRAPFKCNGGVSQKSNFCGTLAERSSE